MLNDDQLRALGRVVVAATWAEFALAVRLTPSGTSPMAMLSAHGGPRQALAQAALSQPALRQLSADALALFERRNRLVHDVAMDTWVGGDELVVPEFMTTARGTDLFETYPAATASELDALADKFAQFASRALDAF